MIVRKILTSLTTAGALRVISIAAVFLLGIYAFSNGVQTTESSDLGEQGLLAWIYYCAALFVLGGLDLGVPNGGPLLAHAALWIAFFLAPIITAATVVEAAIRLLRPQVATPKSLSGHVVLVGAGRLAQTYLNAILAVAPQKSVVHIVQADQRADRNEPPHLKNVRVLPGNPTDKETLSLARLGQADEMVVIAEDDLANLETSWAAKDLSPELPIAVHVEDLTLLRPVSRMIRGSSAAVHPLVFNTHRIAALQLYERLLHPQFETTVHRDVFILGGFGGFTQTILELLRAMATDELQHVVIVDDHASLKMRQFKADVPLAELSHSTVDGQLQDPETWDRVDAKVSALKVEPVYLLACSEEVVNLRTAMLLRNRRVEGQIFARSFRRTQFAETLGKQYSFQLFAFEEVLEEALQDHFRNLRLI
jgi:voltage-gated potassium channel Kch